jgi:hypothetical protein
MVARGPIPCSVARKAVDDDPDPGIEKVMGIVRDRIRDRTGGREDDRLLHLVVESPFSAPAGGPVVHPPMIGPMMPNFRGMIPRPPVMPMVPRSRPAPIMPPPQQAYGWMGGMSSAAPMTGWMPQGPMSGMSPMNPMQNRASISAPPTGIGGRGGTMNGMGVGGAMAPGIDVGRMRREGAGR